MSSPITALDPATEEKTNRNLTKLHCTTIGIAHPLSTIQDAETILVLRDGRIVEHGSHEVLRTSAACMTGTMKAHNQRE